MVVLCGVRVYIMEEILIPFGKYKGKPLTAMAEDSQYIEWLQQQGWLQEKYPQINTLIINNFKEPSETPDHNKIQGMFLDDSFCVKFSERVRYILFENSNRLNEYKKILSAKIKYLCFEVNGIDVHFCFYNGDKAGSYYKYFSVEIKPSVGDDYPSILRQIKSLKPIYRYSCYSVLLINEYCGKGISEENFIKLFYTQGIIVVFVKDVM